MTDSTTRLSEAELTRLVAGLLGAHGVEPLTADALARVIVAAERDGTLSHGLARLPGYLSSLKSGWVDGAARMTVTDKAAAVVHVDAANGFAQGALARAAELAIAKARAAGVCVVGIHDSHHFGSLWPDVEPFAERGLVCMAFVNSRSRIVAPGARRPVLGTNPVAFAFPRKDGAPIVWDLASSVMAHGDVILAAKHGHQLPAGAGVDRDAQPTQDPRKVLDGGALVPFAGHKGFAIALMAEVMVAGLTGSRFGFEDGSGQYPGAVTSNAGQTLVLIDPNRTGGGDFIGRVELLIGELREAGTERLPADRRYRNRAAAAAEGIAVDRAMLDLLKSGAQARKTD